MNKIHQNKNKNNDNVNRNATLTTEPSHLDSKHTLVFPYAEGLTQNLNRISKKYGLQVISNNKHKVSTFLVSLKDPIPLDFKSNIVYSISCGNCEGVYTGQTKRYFKIRAEKHRKGVERAKNTDALKYTALTKHSLDHQHNINFENSKICATEIAPYKRNLTEMIHIARNPNAVNFRTDVNKLSCI